MYISFLCPQNIQLTLEDRDAEELILVLCGYHKLITERELDVVQDTTILQQQEEEQQQGKYGVVVLKRQQC